MCGISGYVGTSKAFPIIQDMLKKLEYRGYDSCGIATYNKTKYNDKLECNKTVRPEGVRDLIPTDGCMGIGHTRWATHGQVSITNAHPIINGPKHLALVMNGVVENYKEFSSHCESDTKAIFNYIFTQTIPREAIDNILEKATGDFSFLLLDKDVIHVVHNGCPVVIGHRDLNGDIFISSDVDAMPTCDTYYKLNKGDIYTVSQDKIDSNTELSKFLPKEISPAKEKVSAHYMLDEINSQATLPNPQYVFQSIMRPDIEHWILSGCGSSYYAAMLGQYYLERLGIRASVEYGSELFFKSKHKEDGLMVFSQSGETADIIRAVEKHELFTVGVVNERNSALAYLCDFVCPLEAGKEVGVAATKTFVAQLLLLASMVRGEPDDFRAMIFHLLKKTHKIKELAKRYAHYDNFLFLGRGLDFPIALEGALKLKEVSYIHAEGMSAAEMKHGPIALIDEKMPCLVINTQKPLYSSVKANIEEIKARGGQVIELGIYGGDIQVPLTHWAYQPILNVIPLQLFAYYVALERGLDPDRPRSLAKCVTV